MFEPTHPAGTNELIRMSQFERDAVAGGFDPEGEVTSGGTRLAALNPSLLQDLQRFGGSHGPAEGLDPLEVMAAALRHARPLLVHMQAGPRVMPLTVWPLQWQVQSPLSSDDLVSLQLDELRVLSVQPAHRDATAATAAAAEAEATSGSLTPLRPFLWELALRGSRERLLPEIAGIATYRVAPGAELSSLGLTGSLQDAVARLQLEGQPLRHIAAFPDFDLNRATRLLNALYLQATLMISRSHPIGIPGNDPHNAADAPNR